MFSARTSALPTLITILVVAVGAPPALADIAPVPSCVVNVDDSPSDGAEEIPLNPMLLYSSIAPFECEEKDPTGSGDMPQLSLTDEEGTVVGLSAEYVTDYCVLVFFPEEDLQPNSVYHVLHDEDRLASFTTGSAADLQAPAFTPSEDGPSPALSIDYESDEHLVLATVVLDTYEGPEGYGITPGETTLDLVSYTDPGMHGDTVYVAVYDAAGNRNGAQVTIDRGGDDDDDDDDDDDTDHGDDDTDHGDDDTDHGDDDTDHDDGDNLDDDDAEDPRSCACTHDRATARPAALLACFGLSFATWMRYRRRALRG